MKRSIQADYQHYLYVKITERMLQHADVGPEAISPKRARYVLGIYRVPKPMRNKVLEDMQEKGHIKRKNKDCLEICS